ncbi:hypothetical protein [Arthrobacter polaris]|uniref:hypothetical protein n=1 Tax=Arthrobacter polaris TaxID=2813727 RepID=UPI001F36776E|nr:hypothetical protein [Arthrobacter polaris]UIK87628.1 hypothetical protein J0916_08765 [Arthrobacter polaris]
MVMLALSLTGCAGDVSASAAETSSVVATTPSGAQPATDNASEAAATKAAATSPAAKAAASTPAAATKATTAPVGRKVLLHVEGAKSDALVKALVITADGKESGGEMTTQTLPFNQELTLPANSVFTKILVLGKYASGATGEISCSISIDGKEVAAQTSTDHKPAECLFVEKNSK